MITGIEASYGSLDAEAYKIANDIAGTVQLTKGTGIAYDRQYKEYLQFFDRQEEEKALLYPGYIPIPSPPITAAKATVYLKHLFNRKKLRLTVVFFWL